MENGSGGINSKKWQNAFDETESIRFEIQTIDKHNAVPDAEQISSNGFSCWKQRIVIVKNRIEIYAKIIKCSSNRRVLFSVEICAYAPFSPPLSWEGGGFHFCDMRMGVVAARTSKCQIKYSTTICVSIRCHCLYFMAFAHGIACCAANAWGGGGASEQTGDWEV